MRQTRIAVTALAAALFAAAQTSQGGEARSAVGEGVFSPNLTQDTLDAESSVAFPGRVPVSPKVLRIGAIANHVEGWRTEVASEPGASQFVIAFKEPLEVGTIVACGRWHVSFLRPGGRPEPSLESEWLAASYPGESGHDLRVVPLAPGVRTAAVRLTGSLRPDQAGRFSDELWLATTFPGRFVNVAPLADVFVSSCAPPDQGFRPDSLRNKPEALADGRVGSTWTSGRRDSDISQVSPEWVVLDWGSERRPRGAAVFMGDGGFGEMLVQGWTREGRPSGRDDSGWETVGRLSGRRPWRPIVWEVYCDFGREVKTRALRFLATRGLTRETAAGGEGADPRSITIAELAVFEDLGKRPVPERLAKEKKTPDGVVPISFTMPWPGKATIQILSEQGEVMENLVAGAEFPAGKNTVWWDLSTLYDYWPPYSKPAPHFGDPSVRGKELAQPGRYKWKGLCHPGLSLSYVCSFNPVKKHGLAWVTADSTGGWLADHSPPLDVVRTGDTMAVGSFCEGGHALLEADTDMRKLWGTGRIHLACPRALAADGEFGTIDYFARKVTERVDPQIDFAWRDSPAPGVSADYFAVRWTGRLEVPRAGRHTFYVTSDDGVRLVLAGKKLIENWTPHGATTDSASAELAAGSHEIVLEFFEHTGDSRIRLEWEPPGGARQVIPASQLRPPGQGGAANGLAGAYFTYDPGKAPCVYFIEKGGWLGFGGQDICMIQVDWRTKAGRRVFAVPKDEKNPELKSVEGLAVTGDRAFVADREGDAVVVCDLSPNLAGRDEKLHVLKKIPVKGPGRIRPYGPDRLACVSKTGVVLIDAKTFETRTLVDGLTNPLGLAVDGSGRIYVGEMEPSHQVKIFSPQGKLIRTVGRPGRHRIGRFDPDNLESPAGLEVDARGRLWVCEASMNVKRTSVWDESGRCVNDVIGPPEYGGSGGGDIDPADENRFFYRGLEFKRDPKTGAVRLINVIWRDDDERYDRFFSGAPHNFGGAAPAYPFRRDGRLFFTSWQGWAAGGNCTLFVYDRDQVRPVAAVGTIPDWMWERLGRARPEPRFGHVVAERVDPEIDFSWPGSPAPGVNADDFAVRWEGAIEVGRPGTYRFITTSDDGVRLFVAGKKVLENWTDHGSTEDSGTVELAAGRHEIKLEFYEKSGGARIALAWEGPGIARQVVPRSALRTSAAPDAGEGLRGRYYHGGHAESIFAWTDSNDDGRAQPDELTLGGIALDGTPWGKVGSTWQTRMNENFEIAFSDGEYGRAGLAFFRVKRLNAKGYPVYELPTQFRTIPGLGHASDAVMVDRAGNAISLDEYVVSMSPEGKENWRYKNRWPGLHAGHHTTASGDEPGVLIATTRFLGSGVVNDHVGEVVSIISNLGATYLFTADGLYIDRVFEDCRRGLSWYFNSPPSDALVSRVSLGDEHFGGTFQRVRCEDGRYRFRYVISAGSPHNSVVELRGLENVKRLDGGSFEVTAAHLALAERLRQQRALAASEPKRYVVRKLAKVQIDGDPSEWPKERIDGFALAYDERYLYVLFEGEDDRAVFQNAATADGFLEAFKTGDVVDVMLATKPGLDPNRENAAEGDIRLSFVPIGGEPSAILYDYVVPGTPRESRLAFSSPWRTLYVDRVTRLADARVAVTRRQSSFVLEAAVPLRAIHLDPTATRTVAGDVGRVLSDQTGTRAVDRVYWSNKNTKIVSDVPSEARLQPNLWGTLVFE